MEFTRFKEIFKSVIHTNFLKDFIYRLHRLMVHNPHIIANVKGFYRKAGLFNNDIHISKDGEIMVSGVSPFRSLLLNHTSKKENVNQIKHGVINLTIVIKPIKCGEPLCSISE